MVIFTHKLTQALVLSGIAGTAVHGQALSEEAIEFPNHERSMLWNNTHTATLEDYKIKDDPSLLYTPEATEAYIKQEEGLNK